MLGRCFTTSEFPQTHPEAVTMSRQAHLVPGATMSIRLDVPVYSDRSRTGDPISATVTIRFAGMAS